MIKRQENNRMAWFLLSVMSRKYRFFVLHDVWSLSSGRYAISRREGENSGKKYDTQFITVESCIYHESYQPLTCL